MLWLKPELAHDKRKLAVKLSKIKKISGLRKKAGKAIFVFLKMPLPSNPCFFFFLQKEKSEAPPKEQTFSAEPLKSLEKRAKTHKKTRKTEKGEENEKTRIGRSSKARKP